MVVGVAIALGLTGFIVSTSYQPTTVQAAPAYDQIIVNWPHIHGLGIDAQDSKTVYTATHNGLYRWSESSEWSFVGTENFDFSSFIMHPNESNVMYASGHPAGNPVLGLGFIGSTDGGLTWQKISDVVSSPVDFHALAISAADPNLIYGYPSHSRVLFKTNDGGKSWEKIDLPGNPAVVSLAAHPKDINQVVAVTDDGRPLKSLDQGKTWKYVNWTSMAFTTIGYAKDGTLYGFVTQDPMGMGMQIRLVKSPDGGKTWSAVGINLIRGEIISALALSPSNPETVYAASKLGTQVNTISSVYGSFDSGITFNLLGTDDRYHPGLLGSIENIIIPKEYLPRSMGIIVVPEEESSPRANFEGLATFLLENKDIQAEDFIHLYDSTPSKIGIAHVGATLPCDENNVSPLVIVTGIIPDLKPAEMELVLQQSNTGMCIYHTLIQPEGFDEVTNIAIFNPTGKGLRLPETSLVSISLSELK